MFYVTLITIDRSPKRNYLADTLQNLQRAGVFSSHLLERFAIIDGGSPSLDFLWDAVKLIPNRRMAFYSSKTTATKNAARAFGMAGYHGSDWTLFLEDDIDVCANFLESVDAWLKKHADKGHVVYPMGANYSAIDEMAARGRDYWSYGVQSFYGTLAVAMRPTDAMLVGAHLLASATADEYDLRIAEWAKGRGITHFLTPAPSFVQHIGAESTIRPGGDFHQYSSWRGKDWSYV